MRVGWDKAWKTLALYSLNCCGIEALEYSISRIFATRRIALQVMRLISLLVIWRTLHQSRDSGRGDFG